MRVLYGLDLTPASPILGPRLGDAEKPQPMVLENTAQHRNITSSDRKYLAKGSFQQKPFCLLMASICCSCFSQ
jgi:hypothetical protein